jgi:hypothetical protein
MLVFLGFAVFHVENVLVLTFIIFCNLLKQMPLKVCETFHTLTCSIMNQMSFCSTVIGHGGHKKTKKQHENIIKFK